jgi:hypothetical protein
MKLFVVQRDYPYDGMGPAVAVYFEFEVEKMLQDYPGIVDDADFENVGTEGYSRWVYVTVERI